MAKIPKNYHEKMLAEGWVPHSVIKRQYISAFSLLAAQYAEGIFSDYRVIPADIAMEGNEWMPNEGQHIVYVKRVERLRHENKMGRKTRGPTVGAILLDCVFASGHEQKIGFTYPLKKR